ncbi:MAG: PfkB family carbohydrate kinase [Akkermansiaceae bacterium]|jgi:sugar/nucleoside kinase (ribokinase family)|tara:strand:- start:1760 stop:2674 length:915 start_codon:yes stop_codon:yes gene_type:complete
MKILVGGSVAIDNVKTPVADESNLLGGSASYAALAAAKLSAPVHLLGIIGNDFPQEHLEMLESHGVDLSGLERSDQPSFTWTGEYHENMNDRTTHNVAINVLEDWQVKVPAELADSPFVVLANMAPINQLQMLEQCTAAEKFVVADTMDLWITVANEELHEVLKKIDLLVINEGEAREFSGTNNLILAGERLLAKGPQIVVVKLGEFGALLFGPEGAFFRCGAWPLRELADPTGAGDTFLGGLIGSLASEGATTPTFDQLKQAVVKGSILASFTCEDFSTKSLEAAGKSHFSDRLANFQKISRW